MRTYCAGAGSVYPIRVTQGARGSLRRAKAYVARAYGFFCLNGGRTGTCMRTTMRQSGLVATFGTRTHFIIGAYFPGGGAGGASIEV